MAFTELNSGTITNLDYKGGSVPYTDADDVNGNYTTDQDGRTQLRFYNPTGGNITVTIKKQITTASQPGYGELDAKDIPIVVSAGGHAQAGPFPSAHYRDTSSLALEWTYSASGLKVAAVKARTTFE